MADLLAHTNAAGQVSMKNASTGEFVWIPKDRAQDAYQAGFEPEAPEAFAKRQEAAQYDAPLTAGGLGVLRGATLGLSDVVATETGLATPGELAKYSEHNPVASPVGEFGGTILGAVAPGGPIARIGGLAARGAGAITTRALPMIARGAAEGALISGGHAVSEAVMHPEVDAAKHISRAALEGMGIGGAMSVGFLGAGLVLRGGAKAASKLARLGKKPTGVAEAAQRQLEGGADVMGGTDWTRLANLRQELADNQRIITSLRRGGAPADTLELAERETRRKVLGGEYGKLQRELLGKKPAAPGTKTTTSTKTTTTDGLPGTTSTPGAGPMSKQSMAEDLAQMEGRVLEGIEGEGLYAHSRWTELNGAVDVHRTMIERMHRNGIPVDEALAQQYSSLRFLRSIARKRSYEAEKAIDRVRKNALFKPEGEALVKTGQVPGQTTVEVTETVLAKARASEKLTAEAADVLVGEGLSQASLQRLSQLKTPGMLDHFLNWRSASTFLGWSLGGPVGGVVGAVLGDSAIRRVIGDVVLSPVIRAARGAGGGILKGAGTKAATAINAAGVEGLRTKLELPHNAPEKIAATAYTGYTEAGMADSHAAPLAALQGAKTQILREAVAETDAADPVSRLRLARTVEAVEDLRSIGTRMRGSNPTREDVRVLNRLFPMGAAALAARATERLADDSKLSPKTRKALEMLAGQDDKIFARLETIQAAFAGQQDDRGNKRSMTRPGSQRVASQQLTTVQRLQRA